MLKNIAVPFASAVVGGLAVILAMPAPKPLPRIIRADKLILDGVDGIPRMIVSGGGDRGASIMLLNREARPALTLAVPDEGNPAIQIGEGTAGIFLTAEAGGLSAIIVKDAAGRDRVRIRVDEAGEAKVETIGADGKGTP